MRLPARLGPAAEIVPYERPCYLPAMPRSRRTSPGQHLPPSLRWSRVNYLLMGAGLASIAGGFLLLARGSTVAAPLLLALGFVVLMPMGIIR
jgi:hypothetical protein